MVSAQHKTPSQKGVSSPSLVGRAMERRLLLDAVTSPPALVMVSGEAGIGKSRLVHEIFGGGGVEQRRVLLARCYPVRDRFTLGPVIEALRDARAYLPGRSLTPLVGALRPLLPELSGYLPSAPDPLLDPRAQRHRTFRALRELLEALGPTVCVLEDLHWADGGTLEFLSFLLAKPPRELALVLTYRGEDLGASPHPLLSLASRATEGMPKSTIELSPLSAQEVRALAAALLECDQIPQQFASSLHARTGGIPFVVEEVVRSLQERVDPFLATRGFAYHELPNLEVPPGVSHSVLERIARLSAEANAVARASAVVGRPTTEDLLRKVAGLPPARSIEGLTEALGGGLLIEQDRGRYGLRHALAAQVVYEDIPTPRRRQLHLRAARALETGPEPRPLAQIAHHFKEAGRLRQWARYAEAATDAASSIGDDRTAAEILEEALRAPGLAPTTHIRMALKLGDAALFGRVPREAIHILQRTLDTGYLSPGLRGQLRFYLARLLLLAAEGSYHRELVRAADELRRRPTLAARALAILATWGPVEDDENQLAWLERALEAAARQDDPAVATEVLATRAVVLLGRGDPGGWRATKELPWQVGSFEERLELVRACKYLAQAALQSGHYRRAESLLNNGERIRSELDHGRFAVGLATVRASLELSTGRWGGLEARTQELMQATAEAPILLAFNQLTLGWLLLARGEVEGAEEQFLSVLEVVQNAQTIPHLAAVTSGLARIQLARGDAQQARQLATMGLDRIGHHQLWACASTVAPVGVEALVTCGELATAADIVRRLARGLRGRDVPGPRAALAFCRGAVAEALGQHDVARRWFEQSEVAWRRLPSPYEAARARERRGHCMLVGKDQTMAAGCVLGALEDFENLGAAWDSARVRRTLRAHRIAAPSRAGRKGYGSELSPREAEVARLASVGATNREIAEALVISERTVESHVAASLKKLRVGSRRAIPRKDSVPQAN